MEESRSHKILRWAKLVRRGVSPVSLVRRLVRGDYSLRFRGVDISGQDMPVVWDVAIPVWAGEYDEPGFVPGKGDVVVDVGGNIGAFAVLAADRGARVSAYEPHPETFAHMARNTAKWGVECHQAAVVGHVTTESVRLYVNPRHIRNTLVGRDVSTATELEDYVDVPAVPIADVLREPADLVKIDCEGGEYDILSADREVLRRARRFVVEVHTALGDADALLATVRAAGFDARLRPSDLVGEPLAVLTAVRV